MKIEEFLDRTVALASAAEREDLVERLERARRRWRDPAVRVLVVGEFKQGKSALVNALVGADVCTVDADIATSVPTVVRYADPPAAELVLADPGAEGDLLGGTLGDLPTVTRTVELAELAAHASERANRDNHQRLLYARAGLPRGVLRGGLEIVDTPGVGSSNSGYAGATAGALTAADALLFVSDATAEYSAAEIDFLRTALRSCPNAACVVTKTDVHAEWSRIVDIDRGHLTRAGLDFPVFPVSARLRQLAIRHQDAELDTESGFPELVKHLRRDIIGRSRLLAARSVAHEVLSVLDNLRALWTPELDALQNPARLPELLTSLEQAQAEAQELRERSARWQTTLNDGFSDIISDLDHDVRERLRVVGRDAEQAIDDDDPATMWEEFTPWFDDRIDAALAETFLWAEENTRWVTEKVAEHFTASATALMPPTQVSDTTGVLERVPSMSSPDMQTVRGFGKVLIGMRGSYGGVLMFGLLTGIFGMSLINPISIGAGVLLGSRAYVEDRATRLSRRRNDAKSQTRRHLDDVQFQVLKVLKDRLRLMQRTLRDHYTTTAEELQRSITESIAAARAGTKQPAGEREDRIRELRAHLGTVDRLSAGARKLMEDHR